MLCFIKTCENLIKHLNMKKYLIIIYLFERYKIDFIIQEKNEIISIGEKIVIMLV